MGICFNGERSMYNIFGDIRNFNKYFPFDSLEFGPLKISGDMRTDVRMNRPFLAHGVGLTEFVIINLPRTLFEYDEIFTTR